MAIDKGSTITEEHKCRKCGRVWKVVLDGMQGYVPDKYLHIYEDHLESCVKKEEVDATLPFSKRREIYRKNKKEDIDSED